MTKKEAVIGLRYKFFSEQDDIESLEREFNSRMATENKYALLGLSLRDEKRADNLKALHQSAESLAKKLVQHHTQIAKYSLLKLHEEHKLKVFETWNDEIEESKKSGLISYCSKSVSDFLSRFFARIQTFILDFKTKNESGETMSERIARQRNELKDIINEDNIWSDEQAVQELSEQSDEQKTTFQPK